MDEEYVILTISSDIIEDSYKHGEQTSTGCGLDEKVGKAFESLQVMLDWLNASYGLSKDNEDYNIESDNLQTSKMVADHTPAQNGGWMKPTDDETEQWRKGNIKLYTERYYISIRKVKS